MGQNFVKLKSVNSSTPKQEQQKGSNGAGGGGSMIRPAKQGGFAI